MPRDPTYFNRLLELLELERGEQRQRYEEEKSQRTPVEQQARGLCLLGLESVEESIGLGGRWLVALEHFDRRPLPARWHPGDVVEVQPHRTDEGKPLSGIVARATRTRVQIAFDRAPTVGALNGRLRVDLVPNDVTFGRARLAVERVQALERGRERRVRELLLGNESPRFDRFIPFQAPQPLNAEQLEAAGRALSAEDFFLIHGPPGTGKSAVLAQIASHCAAQGMSVLVAASSNAAVDHLLELCLDHGLRALRIGHPARVLPHLQEHTLDVGGEASGSAAVGRAVPGGVGATRLCASPACPGTQPRAFCQRPPILRGGPSASRRSKGAGKKGGPIGFGRSPGLLQYPGEFRGRLAGGKKFRHRPGG